jgi:hypothetical protein
VIIVVVRGDLGLIRSDAGGYVPYSFIFGVLKTVNLMLLVL